MRHLHTCLALAAILSPLAAAQSPIKLTHALAIANVAKAGRSIVRTDPIEAAIVLDTFKPPADGDRVGDGDSAPTWKSTDADANGSFPEDAVRQGYLYLTYDSPQPAVMLLECPGSTLVYVNHTLVAGNPYRTDYVQIPVQLKAGLNEFLVGCRGGPSVTLTPVTKPAFISTRDAILPNVIVGEAPRSLSASVLVINASATPLRGARLKCGVEGSEFALYSEIPPFPAPGVCKVPFQIPTPPGNTDQVPMWVEIRDAGEALIDQRFFPLAVRQPNQLHTRTYVSDVDGSVQYYCIVPPVSYSPDNPAPWPTVLSLHGADVEATNQAGAYAPKSWCTVVCPTNRRKFGFDWEDWGRIDALDVLRDAGQHIPVDHSMTYLSGHSMGGHGTWQLGVNHPDLFAAIAPSAGWCSFWSYMAGPRPDAASPVEEIVRDSANPSDTAGLIANLSDRGVAILHGDADDNVPVTEARAMRDLLRTVGVEPIYHEQPGAGHWWEDSDEPGAECLDAPAFFDLFASRRLPRLSELRHAHFATFNPGISNRLGFAAIQSQEQSLQRSSFDIRYEPYKRRYTGTTQNVRSLIIYDLPFLLKKDAAGATIQLDGAPPISAPVRTSNDPSAPIQAINLVKQSGAWSLQDRVDPAHKSSERSGPFKFAFQNHFTLVYGTAGTPEENAWALAKASYDAQAWWVRGNGVTRVLSDREFLAGPTPDCNVILYGHADMNAAWSLLRSDCPVSVRRGSLTIGDRRHDSQDSAVLFVYPRQSTKTLVGVIAGTGSAGMRLADRTPIFTSGVGIPDLVVLEPSLLSQGPKGIRAAAFFGYDWSLTTGRIAWAE